MISCNEYDYIEIVCMFRYPVSLTMISGDIINGIAMDTKRDEAKRECIELNVEDSNQLVVLDEIARLKVAVENPHFTQVVFK